MACHYINYLITRSPIVYHYNKLPTTSTLLQSLYSKTPLISTVYYYSSNVSANTTTSDLYSPRDTIEVTKKDEYHNYNNELINAVTEAYQAQRRFSTLLRNKFRNNEAAADTIEESHSIQRSLGNLKGILDGTKYTCNPIELPPHQLVTLSPLVTAHTIDHMTDAIKDNIADRLQKLFHGKVKRLLFACILSCPWYSAVFNDLKNNDDGLRVEIDYKNEKPSHHNVLYVVYESLTEHFFSLAKRTEELDTINEPPILACEIRQFCSSLFSNSVQNVEVFLSPEKSVILSTPEWQSLKDLVDPLALLNMRFFHSCVGQSVGSFMRRPLTGRTTQDLRKCCDAYRLLSYAQLTRTRELISPWYDITVSEENKKNIETIKSVMKGEITNDVFMQQMNDIKDDLTSAQGFISGKRLHWDALCKEWLINLRKDGVTFTPQPPEQNPDSFSYSHRKLVDKCGLIGLPNSDVILIAKGGSHMYNLALSTSDVDYIIIYKYQNEQIMRNLNMKESLIKRSPTNEFTAYECRRFCEIILNGSVLVFELLYADNIYYTSDHWQQLVQHRDKLLSEHVVSHYCGFIGSHIKKLEECVPSQGDTKILYQAFHKLLSLESFAQGGPPIVTVQTGPTNDFIMNIRENYDLSVKERNDMLNELKERFQLARQTLRLKTKLFPQFSDYRTLSSWLLSVRGVKSNQKHYNEFY